MEYGLSGKNAIVTGASQGIGATIARALHREGVTITLVGQSRARLEQTARDAGSGAAPMHIQVADLGLLTETERVVSEALRHMKHVDILINCAARAKFGGFFTMSDADFQEVWQVKGLGYIRLVRALAPHMMERGDGRIVNIIGSAARTPSSDSIAVSMVNAALVNFTRGISRELALHNVRINSISPGLTLTERQRLIHEMEAKAQNAPVDTVIKKATRAIPLGKYVSMEEIANMALMLVSDLTPGLTGEDIIIDGGMTPSI
jgi:3-oxoacyl-[acyl-carrier protein] reductase/bacilysin biosynthesis oxidoreductase BacG